MPLQRRMLGQLAAVAALAPLGRVMGQAPAADSPAATYGDLAAALADAELVEHNRAANVLEHSLSRVAGSQMLAGRKSALKISPRRST